MIRDDCEMSYEQFLKTYVNKAELEYTISFYFNGYIYQFDYVGAPLNGDGSHQYYFCKYEDGWQSACIRTLYASLVEAIQSSSFEDKYTFEEVYNSNESELIDIS